jgi:hypothetical protein
MIATTIMISTSVNPVMREVLLFILLYYLSVLICGVNAATGGFSMSAVFVHVLPVATAGLKSADAVPTSTLHFLDKHLTGNLVSMKEKPRSTTPEWGLFARSWRPQPDSCLILGYCA